MKPLFIAAWLAALPALAHAQGAPTCESEAGDVRRETSEARLSPDKEQQVRALMEQIDRACREKNDIVASAGLDQVRAILLQERKAATAGSPG